MKKKTTRIILALLIFAGVTLPLAWSNSNYAYAETNESGTVTVIKSSGQVYKDYNNIRDAWDYCRDNYGCTIKFKSNVGVSKELLLKKNEKITVDLNGYELFGTNDNQAFDVRDGGTLIITSTATEGGNIKKGTIRDCKASYGGAIRARGTLEVYNIIFKNCGLDSTEGGAIYLWILHIWIFQATDPHAVIDNCEFIGCNGLTGGAIEVYTDTVLGSANSEETTGNEQAACSVKNSVFTNCNAVRGGALFIGSAATLLNCKIENCKSKNAGGGISVGKYGKLVMQNTDIVGCECTGGPGGGIDLENFRTESERSSAEIYGGKIIGNCCKDEHEGGGIRYMYYTNLKIGGDLVVKNNYNTNGDGRVICDQDNIAISEGYWFDFFDEGLTEGADVHLGFEKEEEQYVGKLKTRAIAEDTARRMAVDYMNNKTSAQEDFGVYVGYGNANTKIYAYEYSKRYITKIEIIGHPEATIDIDNSCCLVDVNLDFKEGGETLKWKVWWYGPGGTISTTEVSASDDNPFNAKTTISKGATEVEDKILIKRRTVQSEYLVTFTDNPKHSVYAIQGNIGGQTEKEFHKGESVSVVADKRGDAVFDHWEVSGIDLALKDRNKETLAFTMPDNDVTAVAIYSVPVTKPTTLITLGGTNKRNSGEPSTAAIRNSYESGSTVVISGTNPGGTTKADKYKFDYWDILYAPKDFTLDSTQQKSESFEKALPDSSEIVLQANYLKKYSATAVNSILNGEDSSIQIFEGEKLKVKAKFITSKTFSYWDAYGIELSEEQMTSETLDLIMPSNDILLIPIYEEGLIYPYRLNIVNGKIKGYGYKSLFFESSLLEIEADTRAGYTFKQWETEDIELTEAQIKSPRITIYMPDNDVELTATYTKNPAKIDTGDHNNLLLYGTVLLLSLIEIGLLIFKRNKIKL